MFTRVSYKEQAKALLQDNWSYMAGLNVIIIVLTFIATSIWSIMPIFGTILASIIVAPLDVSLMLITVKLYRKEHIAVGNLFDAYKMFGKVIGLYLWILLWTILWSLLLIIPGIIKSYSYSMAYYCLINQPELTVREALKESIRITRGYKSDLFILELSWLGWALLCIFTCGIGTLFLNPYMLLTKYIAFRDIKMQKDGFVEGADEQIDDY